uniref:Retrotransposon gag protein n=1 Tax=Solanum tuberosum TaxID=4113 RepID=M1DV34_SOLTU
MKWTLEQQLLKPKPCHMNRLTIHSLKVLNIIPQLHHLRRREKPYIKHISIWIEEQSKDTKLQKGTKRVERMKKDKSGDHQVHLTSHRMDT